jgi:hypothetical protein
MVFRDAGENAKSVATQGNSPEKKRDFQMDIDRPKIPKSDTRNPENADRRPRRIEFPVTMH